MTVQEFTDTLSTKKQFKIALKLTKLCLPIWTDYADNNQLLYTDTVVGMKHKVDSTLLKDAIDTVEKYLEMNAFKKILDGKRSIITVRRKFDDPIAALHDDDWQLPYPVEKTFYAVYNLLEKALGESKTTFGESTIYLCINQAADALNTGKVLSDTQLRDIIYSFDGG